MEKQNLIIDDPKSILAEAFRVLRTNLQFSSIDKPIKKIAITSSQPREGKSTVMANLAISFSMAGYKVLLIDADMRRPTQHKKFLLENHKGLSNLLAEDLPPQSAINKTEIKDLHVLTSGPLPPNPAEILGSAKMKEFMEEVSEKYDIILIDAPPVNSVADASIISAYTDGIILVVAAGETRREAVKIAKQQLIQVKAKILGVVLNKLKESDSGYYYYYYYGEDDAKHKKKKRRY